MKSVIVFLKNVWNAQRNAEHSSQWEEMCGTAQDTARKRMIQVRELEDENAALRSQINQRGAGGRFTKKSPTE